MILREKLFNHIAALFSLFICAFLMLVGLICLDFDKDIFISFVIFFAIDAIPVIYLHIEYYLCNRDEMYQVNQNEIIYIKNGKEKQYKRPEITNIVIYMPPSVYQGSSFRLLGIESYYFARIQMADGEEIIFTCLLTPKIEDAIKKINLPYERRKTFFCSLLLNKK